MVWLEVSCTDGPCLLTAHHVLFQSGMLTFQITSPSTPWAPRKRMKTLTTGQKVRRSLKKVKSSRPSEVCVELEFDWAVKSFLAQSHQLNCQQCIHLQLGFQQKASSKSKRFILHSWGLLPVNLRRNPWHYLNDLPFGLSGSSSSVICYVCCADRSETVTPSAEEREG